MSSVIFSVASSGLWPPIAFILFVLALLFPIFFLAFRACKDDGAHTHSCWGEPKPKNGWLSRIGDAIYDFVNPEPPFNPLDLVGRQEKAQIRKYEREEDEDRRECLAEERRDERRKILDGTYYPHEGRVSRFIHWLQSF